MRSRLPGAPIVEHVRNAPSTLMGVGASVMIIGLLMMMALSEAEINPIFAYIGVGGVFMVVAGLAIIVIGYALLERSWKT